MGKRTRKTRWRTLPIGDEQSDSEESNSTLDTRIPPTYHQKYYNRFTYSSQSTPTRRYQSDSTKSTRSSSTASENKITFNEDEYTRITTPRQDVLFKKGYLNKPKNYSTQTSTGNSTTSTGNSTGNGTPDYQSTDLEYESHFVFPNGFLDQNGIYYVNSYDPYPLMVYNAPPYYNDTWSRSKKYSTESLAETASTTNEETTQDAVNQNGGTLGNEIQQTPPPQSNNHPQHPSNMPPPTEYGQVYNVVYPGFYYNGLCPPQDLPNGQSHQSELKRIKRRRRRKQSSSKTDGTTSEYTEDEVSSDGEDQEVSQKISFEESSVESLPAPASDQTKENSDVEAQVAACNGINDVENAKENATSSGQVNVDSNACCDSNELQNLNSETHSDSNDQSVITNTAENSLNFSDTNPSEKKAKYDLKPDAQEFVPRAMRPENLQYYKIPPNFVPVPLLNPMGAQNYNHAYLPPGIPINFIHQNHPMYPGYVPGYIPPNFSAEHLQSPTNVMPNEEIQHQQLETEAPVEVRNSNDVDIRTVVSKLEEVVNDPPKSEDSTEKSQQISTNKKPIPYRQQDDRKKYLKNTKQNGFFQRRSYNKYHNNGYNETHHVNNHCKEEIIQECSDIQKQRATTDVHVELRKDVIVESAAISLDSSTVHLEKIDEQLKTNGTKEESNNELNGDKFTNTARAQTDDPKLIRNGKIHNSPKFQPKSPENIPKETNKDTLDNSEYKKRWQKRDERNFQRKDQTIQHPEDRINQNYKPHESPNHKFNRKFVRNSPSSRQNQFNGQTQPFNDPAKKYSETVKKSPPLPKPILREVASVQEIKPVSPEVINTPINKTQWISVSSKKKRRNRNQEESEENFDVPEEPEQTIRVDESGQNTFLQNMIINGQSNGEELQVEEPTTEPTPEILRKSPVKILELRDLEKELLSSVGVEVKEDKEVTPTPEERIVEQQNKPKSSSKKKTKKSTQKQPIKRVIVTDVDLSESHLEVKVDEVPEEIQVIPEKPEEKEPEVEPTQEDSLIVESNAEISAIAESDATPMETLEKKSKRKKKKQLKTPEVSSNTQTTLLTNCEDTYDLLLENTFSNSSDDRTNLEISQELDLIIQRGMYSNLEEKIKSLNIIPVKEEFFQSVVRSSRESSMEKSPEFTKLLANSMPKFRYCMASVEDNTSNTPKIPLANLDQPSTSKNGMFVENLEVSKLLKDIYGKEGTPEAELDEIIKKISPPREIVIEKRKEKSVERKIEPEKEKLYPITQAVKNWMTKTRENTPEVEILKSPSVIFKEFCDKSSDEESAIDSVNGKRNSAIFESDEEITVYSASRNNSDGVDLLECWENEITIDSCRKSSSENGCDIETKNNSDNKEDEEAMDVYESKYGQNEDFLQLQKEIEEKKKQENDARSRNFPKHGALPYRAICCSIM